MARNTFLRALKYLTLRHPLATIVVVVTLYTMCYHMLSWFPIAQEILNTIMMLFSSEAAVIMLYNQGKTLSEIITRLLTIEACVFTFDQFLAIFLLRWGWFREFIQVLSTWGNALVKDIRKKFGGLMPNGNNTNGVVRTFFKRLFPKNGVVRSFFRRLFQAYKEPANVGLKIVFALGLFPKPPVIPIGGVSIGVIVVRYNHYGWRGWVALIGGMLIRNTVWLLGVYGVSAIL